MERRVPRQCLSADSCRAAHGEHVASTLEGRDALLGFGASCQHLLQLVTLCSLSTWTCQVVARADNGTHRVAVVVVRKLLVVMHSRPAWRTYPQAATIVRS